MELFYDSYPIRTFKKSIMEWKIPILITQDSIARIVPVPLGGPWASSVEQCWSRYLGFLYKHNPIEKERIEKGF